MSDELFSRLHSFVIGEPDVALPFHRRLAHENGWSAAFAQRVIAEYKRFVWLAVRAGHPVTPPPAVDEAWHLHLCYTRSYHDELCARVLGQPLHHGPTRGGPDEAAKYASWYARTLASYREHFGEPPADVWPAVAERSRAGIARKVDPRTHWVVQKRAVRRAMAAAGAGVVVAALAGCTGMLAAIDTEAMVYAAVGAAVLFGAVAMVRRFAKRRNPFRGADGASGGGASSGGVGFTCGGCGRDADSGGGGDGGGGGGCGGGGD